MSLLIFLGLFCASVGIMDYNYIVEGNRERDVLLGQLRRFFHNNVKIPDSDLNWAKGLVDDILKRKIFRLCQEKSQLPISHFEYTGSLYERLKIKAADEVDVMVVLRTGRAEVMVEEGVPGYVRLKVGDKSSPFYKYTDYYGYLLPEKFRSAWYGLITKVVAEIKKEPSLSVRLDIRSHGPAIQLDITDEAANKLLSCDLVPSFRMGEDYYVAKPYPQRASAPSYPYLLWRQSFSVKEKFILADMDRDFGCRHELLRIVKTIIRSEPTFYKLTSYHLKTAFLRYKFGRYRDWYRDRLADRFKEYLGKLLEALERKTLPHFWVNEIDLFEDINPTTLENMADRLRRILNDSRGSLTKILEAPVSLESAFPTKPDDWGCHIL